MCRCHARRQLFLIVDRTIARRRIVGIDEIEMLLGECTDICRSLCQEILVESCCLTRQPLGREGQLRRIRDTIYRIRSSGS